MGSKHWGKTQPKLPTEEEIDSVVESIMDGLSLGVAAKAIGVPPLKLKRWVDKGEYQLMMEGTEGAEFTAVQEAYKAICLRVWKAQADFQREVLADVLASPAWQGKMAILRANFPETYEPDHKITVSNSAPQISRAVTLRDVRALTSSDLESLRDINARRQGEQVQLEDQSAK